MRVAGIFKQDLTWFLHFISDVNGICTFANWGGSIQGEVHVDASYGVWGQFLSAILLYSIAYIHFVDRNRTVLFEMINILVYLRVYGAKNGSINLFKLIVTIEQMLTY